MPKYFEGYYCKDDNSVEGIKTENSRKVLQAISYAYPDGITAEEISQRINIPYDTVSASLTTLGSYGFIIREKNKPVAGRPKTYDKPIDSRAFKYYIENRNFALNEEEAHQYAPGYIKYASDFLYAWNILVEEDQQNEIYRLLLKLLNVVMTKISSSNDPVFGYVIPSSGRWCKFCGINHEARDFIRAILLHLLDNLESTRPFIDFLEKNQFILKDSYGYNHLLEQASNHQEPKKKQQAKEWLNKLTPEAKRVAELILKKKPTIEVELLMERVNFIINTPYPDEEDPGSYIAMDEHEALSVIANELGLDPNLPDQQRQQNVDIANSPFLKKIIDVEHSLTNHGVKVTLHKVEFTSKYTRAFLKIENSSKHHENPVNFGFSAVLIQGKRQLGYVDRFKDVFPRDGCKEINLGSIPPGVEEEGVAVFQPVELTSDASRTIKLRFDSSVSPFIFEVPLEEGEGKQRPAIVTEDSITKVIEVNQTKTGGGIFVTLHKVEFSDHYTAAFLTVENKNSHESEIVFLRGRIIQGKRQFGITSDGPRYKHIKVTIPGGIEEQGVEKFEAIDYGKGKARFEFQLAFVRTKESYQFDFDVDVPK